MCMCMCARACDDQMKENNVHACFLDISAVVEIDTSALELLPVALSGF